ncbi:MAG: SAM-dependent methyltransferase [Bacteroidetes bacterium]|nr:SAM-dependent methyltransferase [Bacteroidota bacterium]
MSTGKLFLIPTIIADGSETKTIPPIVFETLKSIQHFLVEDVRTARRYLSGLKIFASIEELNFSVLNKDTPENELPELFKPVFSGHPLGVLSESGCPGVADPGALAVAYAHQKNIPVIPLVGPSSIILALMASGLNGQQFAFHGYLPIDAKECAQKIKQLEKESTQKRQTQILIETPYRNNQILKHLLDSLHATTQLCLALDLTGENEFIKTKAVADWKKNVPNLPKVPAVFLFLA